MIDNTIIIVIVCILLFLLIQIRLREKFSDYYGMNYINTYNYFKCCNDYGCNSNRCQRILNATSSPLELYGYIEAEDDTFHNIYRRLDQNTRNYEYFIKNTNDQKDYYYDKLDPIYKFVYDGDTITYNEKDYVVHTYSQTYYGDSDSWINKWTTDTKYLGSNPNYFPNSYSSYYNDFIDNGLNVINSQNYRKIGVIKKSDGSFQIVYRKSIGRNQYEYYTNIEDILIKLDTPTNRELYDGDIITLNSENYTFYEV